jgi:hypothetical protein
MGERVDAGSFSRAQESLPPVEVSMGEWLREIVWQSDGLGSSRCHILNRSKLNFR